MAPEVPVIDLSQDEEAAAEAVRLACIRFGFFTIKNHGVSDVLVEAAMALNKRLFELPLEKKLAVKFNSEFRGYTPMAAEILDLKGSAAGDTKEGFYLGPEYPAGTPGSDMAILNSNQWPAEEDLPGFRDTMEEYMEAILALGRRLVRLLALALHMPATALDEHFRFPRATVRLLHYAPQASDPDAGLFAAGAHTDYGVLTILKTDMVGGLQLELDGQWVPLAPVKDTFCINLGDMLQRWTNDKFISTKHRVITAAEERWSIPCFFDCHHDTMVEVLPQCCTAEDPARYPPINSKEYLLGKLQSTYAAAAVPEV